MAVPGPAGSITGVASVLVVGALALLAGHRWAMLVIAAGDVLLVGQLWPAAVGIEGAPSAFGEIATVVSLVCALPGLLLFVRHLPAMVEVVLGGRTRGHGAGVTVSAIAAGLWLVSPALPLGDAGTGAAPGALEVGQIGGTLADHETPEPVATDLAALQHGRAASLDEVGRLTLPLSGETHDETGWLLPDEELVEEAGLGDGDAEALTPDAVSGAQ